MAVACVAGFVAFLAALLLAGFAFDAARFIGFAPPHWHLVVIACSLLPLVGLAGLASVRATPLLRSALVWAGGFGSWALAVYEVALGSLPRASFISLVNGGPLAGLALSATVVAAAAVVLLVAGLLALRQHESPVRRGDAASEEVDR
jgi:hypothetical protein